MLIKFIKRHGLYKINAIVHLSDDACEEMIRLGVARRYKSRSRKPQKQTKGASTWQ